jgi:hypothetical protein
LREEGDHVAGGDPSEINYRFAGRQIGAVGNNGTLDTTYDASIASRTATPGTGAFRNGAASGSAYADFDQSLSPITSFEQGSSAGFYSVRAGDTLASIAAALWGDGALWYALASPRKAEITKGELLGETGRNGEANSSYFCFISMRYMVSPLAETQGFITTIICQ